MSPGFLRHGTAFRGSLGDSARFGRLSGIDMIIICLYMMLKMYSVWISIGFLDFDNAGCAFLKKGVQNAYKRS